jgi:hypothetical protein
MTIAIEFSNFFFLAWYELIIDCINDKWWEAGELWSGGGVLSMAISEIIRQ